MKTLTFQLPEVGDDVTFYDRTRGTYTNTTVKKIVDEYENLQVIFANKMQSDFSTVVTDKQKRMDWADDAWYLEDRYSLDERVNFNGIQIFCNVHSCDENGEYRKSKKPVEKGKCCICNWSPAKEKKAKKKK